MKTQKILKSIIMVIVLVLTAASVEAAVAVADVAAGNEITILHHQSEILQTPWKTSRVAVTDPLVADIQVLTPDQVLIQGLSVGTTDIILWSEDEQQVLQKKITVTLDVDKLRAQLGELFPSSSLLLSDSGENLVVRGTHKRAQSAAQLQEFLEKSGISFVDMTSIAGVQQVQLQVRVAEVSKTGLRKLGIDWFFSGSSFSAGASARGGIDSIGFVGQNLTTTTDSSLESLPDLQLDNAISGSGMTSFGILPTADFAYFLDAMAQNQYLRLLAEPTLIALNGEEAGFLAGGEFPIPVVQNSSGGGGGNTAISIEYREYGVRLKFRPTVLGDGTIRLYVYPEVSELDYSNGTTVAGTSVPGVLSRKAKTTIELNSGQSFAIAGLLNDSINTTNSSLPGLGDLPVLGPLFRSVSYQRKETELVIMVTANLVEPLNIDPKTSPVPGSLHQPPSDWELYIDGKQRSATPALDTIDAEWLKELGLDELNGPGAWDTYGAKTPVSRADMM